MKPQRKWFRHPLFWGLLFLASLIFSLASGSAHIDWWSLLSADVNTSKIAFWKLRLPRSLAAAAVGGSLAMVGAVLQSGLRNPMADPFLLGVSSAAATGAVVAMALGFSQLRFFSAALLALACLWFLDRMACRTGRFSNHSLLIAGVAVTYLFSSLTGLVVSLSDPQKTRGLIFWLMGGFSSLDSLSVGLLCLGLGCSSLLLLTKTNELDVLATGDESAHVLGLRPDTFRRVLFLGSSILVALTVATAGGIGFVGMLVPHLARQLCGVSHRQILPVCLFGGAALCLLADTACRVLLSPKEIPVGLVTALLGAPFFLYQLRKGSTW